jgi:hypothetical protein
MYVRKTDGLSREVDIELGNIAEQVKSGNARDLIGQINKTTASTGRTAIGCASDMRPNAWRAAALQGVPIARTPDELVALVKELG